MKLKIKLIERNGVTPNAPKYQTQGAAAMDLEAFIVGEITLPDGHRLKVPTGLQVEIPQGYAGLMLARSGLGTRGITISNSVGLIDSDYRGEISATLYNTSGDDFVVKNGDRIAQLMLVPVPQVEIEVCAELSQTERGEGGFGSTGISKDKA